MWRIVALFRVLTTTTIKQNTSGERGLRRNHTSGERELWSYLTLLTPISLVYHLFEHDLSMTLVKHRNPLISYSEVSTPLPAPRSLWLSPTASAWKTRWLTTKYKPTDLSLQDLLRDESAIRCLTPEVDEQIARSAYLYGLGSQVWEHNNQALILRTSNDASSQLWLQSREQKLYFSQFP